MIKIISGYSHAAGATLALVNLCNQFNSRGYACVFYGPDNWHLEKCKSAQLAEFVPKAGDIILVNDIPLWSAGDLSDISALVEQNGARGLLGALGRMSKMLLPSKAPPSYNLFLTCPNNDTLPKASVRLSFFRKVHFTCEALANYSRISRPLFVAPSFCVDLKKAEHKPEKTAGVIGSIKKHNNTVEAVEKALLDGMETVILFGYMKDPLYYYEKIAPLAIKYPGKIKYAGFIDDRQKMYDAISDTYASVNKPWSTVGHESAMTNTRYHAPEPLNADGRMTNDQIFEIWKNELAL